MPDSDVSDHITTHREQDGTVIAVSADFSTAQAHFDAFHSKAYREFGEDFQVTSVENSETLILSDPGLGSPESILQ